MGKSRFCRPRQRVWEIDRVILPRSHSATRPWRTVRIKTFLPVLESRSIGSIHRKVSRSSTSTSVIAIHGRIAKQSRSRDAAPFPVAATVIRFPPRPEADLRSALIDRKGRGNVAVHHPSYVTTLHRGDSLFPRPPDRRGGVGRDDLSLARGAVTAEIAC